MFVNREGGPETPISGVYVQQQYEGQEELADGHPDIVAYHCADAKRMKRALIDGKATSRLNALNLALAGLDDDMTLEAAQSAATQIKSNRSSLRAAVDAAATAEEVEAVDIAAGW